MKPDQKILIISLSGLGDLILFTPCLPLIRKRFPKGEITLLAKKPEAGKLLKKNPYLDSIIVFDPQKATIGENLQFYLRMRKRGYDISLSSFPAMTLLNNVSTFAIGARERWIYRTGQPWRSFDFLQNRRLPYRHGRHRLDYNLALVRALTGNRNPDQEDPRQHLYIHLSDQTEVWEKFLRPHAVTPYQPLVGMHPGSGDNQPFKRWGEEKFALLADIIHQNSPAQVVLLGGPEEQRLCEKIARLMATRPVIAAGGASLDETLSLIQRCDLVISNDSGVMNMAFALHKRILAIFGPTDDTCTRPLGKDDVCLYKDVPCKQKCRQRYLFRQQCEFGYQCLVELSVDEVWNVARSMLQSIGKQRKFQHG